MKLWSTCNLRNLVLSQLTIKRNTKSKRSLTPGSGGASYGTWLSLSGGHSNNMWLPHTDVHAPAAVEDFHLQHPDTPCTSSASTLTTSCHLCHHCESTPLQDIAS